MHGEDPGNTGFSQRTFCRCLKCERVTWRSRTSAVTRSVTAVGRAGRMVRVGTAGFFFFNMFNILKLLF